MHGQEDDIYVFKNWHAKSKLKPLLKQWCESLDLKVEDQNETWFYDSFITYTENKKLLGDAIENIKNI